MKGTKIVTRNDMMAFQLPEQTQSYTVVSNKQLIEDTLEAFDKEGFRLVRETYRTQGKNSKFVGTFQLRNDDNDFDYSFSFKNSYDKSMSAGVATGICTLVCLNGNMWGEETLYRKHTGAADKEISKRIHDKVKLLGDSFEPRIKQLNRMKEIEMTKKTMAELIGNLYINEELIRANQLSIIKKEILKPTFDYGVDENSLFALYSHITHSFKNAHPTEYISQHVDLHNYLTQDNLILS